ncbi:hypothetical protein BLNAU_9377 [Blattamonas nauphoetae]|uniref:Uncharacterized protein n=1 Tax=Blattamonas nauphoetae TaxID=2049346 RepID=A0ABQ9XW36_9EUKA|nr:hypothetical protein BLNAU_9377 [Blattamonas nauphoetae]
MILFFSTLLNVAYGFYEPPGSSFQSFDAFLNAQSSIFTNENKAARNLTEVGRATFYASNHIFRSETVSLVGHGSRLVHTNQVNSDSQSSTEMSNKMSSERIPILGIVNSSVTMTWWILESVAWNSGICTVDESNVTISDCEIISSSLQSPFVVMSFGSAHPSSISVLSSRYTSTNDHLFPLVGLPPSLTAQSRMISLNRAESSNTFDVCVAETTIFGNDVAFSHEVLALGTGPLFSFGLNTLATSPIVDFGSISVRTSLSNAAFVNVSSTSQLARPTSPMFGSSMSQHVSSSRVSSCTNHDEGTAFLDVHFGGSLHALNTSFSDCSRQSNLVVDESHRNITQTGRLFNVSLECTSVKYSHCTYCHMTSADAGNHGGSAIFLRDVYVPLTLVCCFFDDCTATVKNNDGGAVHYQGVIGDLKPCLFTNCSFTECRVTQLEVSTSGGSIIAYHTQITTINHCFFDKSFAGGRAGAIYSSYCKFIVFNTAFIGCQTGYYGGAMFVFGLDPFLFHSVLFRDNKAGATFANAKDVAMSYFETLDLTDCFVNCNTNSKVGLYLCDGEGVPKENNTVLIPQNTSTFTISTPNIAFTADRATITVTASEALSGTMSFLLSGCLLPRLVHVEFGLPNHPSTTGQGIVTSGADGILPSPPSAAYSVRKWSWGGHVFPPFVLSATASPVDAETGQIDMTGIYLTSGTYSMVVRGSDDSEVTTVPVFESQSALTVTHGMSSTESNKLKYEMEYTIEEVRCDGELVRMESVYTFTIPYPASTLDGVDQTNDSDWTQLRFVGTNLVGARYTLWLETDDAVSPPHSTTVELSPSSLTSLSTWTAVLYPLTAPTLLYGRSYKVLSAVSVDGLHAPTITVGSFSTPSEPARIVSLVLSKYEDSMKTAVFSVTGRALTPNLKYSVFVNVSGTSTQKEIFVTATGAESGIGKAILFSTDVSEIELSYSTTYTVEGVEDKDGVSVLYHSGLTFTTGSEPMRLVTFRIERYLEKDKKVEFRMTGQKLETDETYDVSLSIGSSVKHFVSMKFSASDDAWMGSALLYPLSDAELSYGVEYNVTEFSQTVSSTTTTHFFESNFVKIMAEPRRLISIDSIVATGMNKSVLTLSSRTLTPNDQYELVFTGSPLTASNADHIFAVNVTVTSALSSTVDVTLYPSGANTVKYGHEYVLTSMIQKGESESILFENDGCKFRTPSEPARLKSIAASELKGDQKSLISLTITTAALLPNTPYSLTLLSTWTGQTPSHKRVLTMTTTEAGLLPVFDACLYPFVTLSGSQLSYNTTYNVDSLSWSEGKTLVDFGLSFSIPVEPARVEDVDFHLSGNRRRLEVTLIGRHLAEGMGKVCLKKDNQVWESLDVIELMNSTHAYAEFNVDETQSPSHIKYQNEYQVVPMGDASSGFFVNEDVVILVPAPPHITSIHCEFLNSLQNICKIQLKGTDFIVGTEYDVTLNNKVRIIVRFKTSSEGESEGVSIGKNGKLQYNTRYTLTDVKPLLNDDGEILHSGTLSFETGYQKVLEVIVREGGSSEISECGTIGKPCESVLVGWRVGEDEGVSGVVVKIDESVGFGGRVVVGEKEVEIGGLFEGENDLKVSSGDLSEDGVEGVVSVSGGRVVIVGVRLILPSGWEMREKRVRTVLSGFGECVVRSMSIVSGWKGEGVGMGLVSWLGGSLSVEKIVMEGVEMESGILLVNCSSLKKEVSLDLTSNRFIGVETRNVPLVDFSSKSKESCFSMRDCVFVSTERVESGVVGDRMGVIAVETWQEKMSIENCRFSDCGTVEGRSGSSKKGGVLIVVVGGSNVGERKELELLGNVFMDSCVSWSGSGEEKRGGVTVWSVGVGQTKIDLCGSWFEETSVSGAVLDRDSFGIPIVDGKRKIPSPNSPFSDDSPPSQRKPRLDAYHTTVVPIPRPYSHCLSRSSLALRSLQTPHLPKIRTLFLHAHTGTFSINPFFISPSNNNRRALTSLFSAPPLPLQSQSILPHHPTAPSHSSLPFQKVSANIAPNMVRVDTILIGQHRHTPTTCHADITAEVTPSSEVNIASRFNTPDTPTDCPSARHFPSEDIMHYHISESHCQ